MIEFLNRRSRTVDVSEEDRNYMTTASIQRPASFSLRSSSHDPQFDSFLYKSIEHLQDINNELSQ